MTGREKDQMLVAAPERWDEACFLVPAVRALAASGLDVGVLCLESQRGFWETVEGISIIGYEPSIKARALAEKLAGSCQATLVWEPGLAAEAFFAAAIPRRIGPDHPKLKKRLTHPVTVPARPDDHRVKFYLAAVEAMGVETRRPEFYRPAKLAAELQEGAVLLCPDSDFGVSHEWPLERWLEVARALMTEGAKVTVASLPLQRGRGKALRERLGEDVPMFEMFSGSAELPLLAAYPLVIAADGSLPHLAAHAGATCITLFGPNDPLWKRPLGRHHTVVRRHVECAPCLAPKCVMDLRCQEQLEVEAVLKAVRSKLAVAV